MLPLRLRGLIVALTMSLALLVAACGNTTVSIITSGNNQTPAATATSGGGNPAPTPTTNSGGGNPTVTPTTQSCADGNTSLFVHTAAASTIHTTSDNSTMDSTYIDSCYINGHANYMLTVTPNWSYHANGVYDNHPIGVWYDNAVQKWAIFNEDQTQMPANAAFNVLVASQQNSNYFTLTASGSNSNGDYVKTNVHDASYEIFVTQNFDPNGAGYKLNNHNVGVWYDGSEWAIYNEDQTTMQSGVSFNVVAQPHNTNFDLYQVTAPSTNHANYTIISNALTDNQPNKLLFITHNWGDSAGYMIYYNYPMGVWYTSGHWSVFNENTGVNMPTYMTINVLVQG